VLRGAPPSFSKSLKVSSKQEVKLVSLDTAFIHERAMINSDMSAPARESSESASSNSPSNSLQLARQRAVTFEKEYQESIQELSKVEIFLKELLGLRKNWLTKDGTSKHLDFESTKKHFEILKLQTDILSSKVDLDKYTLESYYEAQQLKQLVEGTKPTEPNDPKGKMREVKMERLMRDGAENLKRSLTESILFRQNASSESKRLVSMLDNKFAEKLHHDEMIDNDADNTLTLFVDRAKKSLQKSKASLKLVTGNYLVLRHNSRMATEILTKSRNDISMQRKQLRDQHQHLLQEVETKKHEDEENRKKELEIQIRRQRSEVMKYESELELKWNENEDIRDQQNKSIKDIKLSIKTYDAQYNALQVRRRKELINVQSQLTRLREELSVAEEAVYSARRNKDSYRTRLHRHGHSHGHSHGHGHGISSDLDDKNGGERSRKLRKSKKDKSTVEATSNQRHHNKNKNNNNPQYAQFCSKEYKDIDGSNDREVLKLLQERMQELKDDLEDL
jgi:hypothetical protein